MTPIAIDTDARRAFVACEGNAKFVVLDLQSMQVVFTVTPERLQTCWMSIANSSVCTLPRREVLVY